MIEFAALFALDTRLFERAGYYHPADAPIDLLVCPVRGEESSAPRADWPAGSVDTQGEW